MYAQTHPTQLTKAHVIGKNKLPIAIHTSLLSPFAKRKGKPLNRPSYDTSPGSHPVVAEVTLMESQCCRCFISLLWGNSQVFVGCALYCHRNTQNNSKNQRAFVQSGGNNSEMVTLSPSSHVSIECVSSSFHKGSIDVQRDVSCFLISLFIANLRNLFLVAFDKN
jgi:hypothetical protein